MPHRRSHSVAPGRLAAERRAVELFESRTTTLRRRQATRCSSPSQKEALAAGYVSDAAQTQSIALRLPLLRARSS